jgi:hypothetical protein
MTRRIRQIAAAGFVAASAWIAADALSAQQVRDRVATPPPAATAAAGGGAVVSGTLLSDELTPQPVRRAQVSLISSDATVARNTLTDAAGRFAFADLPAGRFTLAASKPGWVRASYGAKRYDRPGTTITLTDGQKMTGVAMKMAHGGVIAGTILDENGMPAQGVQVRVMQYRMLNGERTLAPVTAGALFGEATDDRGAFRLFGLPAGDYVLSAQPRNTGGEIRAMTPAEIRAALAALQQPNAPSATVNATAGAPSPGQRRGRIRKRSDIPPSTIRAPSRRRVRRRSLSAKARNAPAWTSRCSSSARRRSRAQSSRPPACPRRTCSSPCCRRRRAAGSPRSVRRCSIEQQRDLTGSSPTRRFRPANTRSWRAPRGRLAAAPAHRPRAWRPRT